MQKVPKEKIVAAQSMLAFGPRAHQERSSSQGRYRSESELVPDKGYELLVVETSETREPNTVP